MSLRLERKTIEKCRLIEFPVHADGRGNLCVLQYDQHIPFKPERTFWVWNVPQWVSRGGHAHAHSSQIHICVGGTAKVKTHDGEKEETFVLDSPNKGLFTEPMVWGEFELSSPNAFLIVISSHTYDKEDYIKDYNEFLRLSRK